MKKVKIIYFPVIVLLILAFSIVSLLHVSNAGNKTAVSAAFIDGAALTATTLENERSKNSGVGTDSSFDVRKKVEDLLKTFTYPDGKTMPYASPKTLNMHDSEGKETGETYNIAYYRSTVNNQYANYYIQSEVVKQDTISKMAHMSDDDTLYTYVGKTVNNIVVYIPGTKTLEGTVAGDAVLLTAHMDSSKIVGNSADASNSVMVAVMLEEIERIVEGGVSYDNDLVFLFTDARYDSSLGIHTFMNQFYGFRENQNDYEIGEERYENDLTNRIKFAVNYDSIGTGNSSMLVSTSDNNAKVVAEYAKAMGGSYSNSFVSDMLKDYQSDFSGIQHLNSLGMVTFGKLYNDNNAADSVSNLGEKQLKALAAKKGSMLRSTVEHFGKLDLNNLDSDNSSMFFSFLGWSTITTSKVTAYALGAVVLALLIAAIVFSVLKKSFDLKAMGRGVLMQVLAIAASMLAVLLVFLFSSLILSGFGVFTVQSIITLTYANTGIIIGYALFAAAMLGLFYGLFKGMLSVKATDTVRGGAVLFTLASAVLCFALPSLGFTAAIPAIFVGAVLLATALFKNSYKKKFGEDMERMMLYLIPIAVSAMFFVPLVAVLTQLVPAILLPVTLLPVVAMLMLVCPYMLALKPMLGRLVAKLPQRTIRVQYTVTETVEDAAKKGKFTEVTRKQIKNEKTAWKYRHGVGMAIVAVIASVVIMISSGVNMPVGASVYGINTGRQTVASTLFDDSLLVVWEHSGEAKTTLQIRDKATYKNLRYVLDDYSWSSSKDAYIKNFNWTSDMSRPEISGSSNKVQIKPALNGTAVGYSEITIKSASTIESIKFLDATDEDIIMTVINDERKDEMVITLPLGDSTQSTILFRVDFYTGNPSTSVNLVYRQYSWYSSVTFLESKSDDFGAVKNYMSENDLSGSIRFGMYYEYPINVSIN